MSDGYGCDIAASSDNDICELTIDEMKRMLAHGGLTSTELVIGYLNRLFYYDVNGIQLNSTPIVAADAIKQAMSKDDDRANGRVCGDLHGIPYLVKDSYMAKGMTMAAGSPAFAQVVANEDSFSVKSLRAAGAILLGRTNMPPMAAGGVQRGLYGRAENPYNPEYLSAAWYSGSSNGSAVATSSSFAAFGLGEETVSSGRSPAANNGLVAYTPSRGVISLRGNWPLHATKDEVVPHTRTMSDLLQILPTLIQVDTDTRGDMWRWQRFVPLEGAQRLREEGITGIENLNALQGMRIGVVNEYAGRAGGRIPSVYTRPSIGRLLIRALGDLRALGASVEWTCLPLRDAYESAPRTLKTFSDQKLIPSDWMGHEWLQLNTAVLEEFIRGFDISGIDSLADVDPNDIFPNPFNSIARRNHWQYGFYHQASELIQRGKLLPARETPDLEGGLRGLEAIRKHHFEEWMAAKGYDALVFPTNSNIGRADADVDEVDNTEAWQDGAWFSNGNRMLRHLGIPSVTVTMGVMDDTGVPAGLTFIGASGSDRMLLAGAYAYERSTDRRIQPRRTPEIERLKRIAFDHSGSEPIGRSFTGLLTASINHGRIFYQVRTSQPQRKFACRIFVNGLLVDEWNADEAWEGSLALARVFDARVVAVVALFTGKGGTVGGDIDVQTMPGFGKPTNSLI